MRRPWRLDTQRDRNAPAALRAVLSLHHIEARGAVPSSLLHESDMTLWHRLKTVNFANGCRLALAIRNATSSVRVELRRKEREWSRSDCARSQPRGRSNEPPCVWRSRPATPRHTCRAIAFAPPEEHDP